MPAVNPKQATTNLVCVVDDDEAVRKSLCALLKAHGFEAEAFANAESLLKDFDVDSTLCAFLDIRMPGMNGIQLQKVLAESGSNLPIIILTAYGDVPLAVEAMKAGAIDFIEKPASAEQLLSAIDVARRHRSNQSQPSIAQSIVTERVARLTGREKEVLNYLILGMTNKHIAEELGISQRTIEIHRSRIREKMEARSLADLIRMMR